MVRIIRSEEVSFDCYDHEVDGVVYIYDSLVEKTYADESVDDVTELQVELGRKVTRRP